MNRSAEFDPALDSAVRVEAGRLRAKLREYYDIEGNADRIRFELPKGRYNPNIKVDGSTDGQHASRYCSKRSAFARLTTMSRSPTRFPGRTARCW